MTKADSLILVLVISAQVNLIIWDNILLNNKYHNINNTLRNAVLYNATSVRDIIIQYLSTAEMRFDVTSALVLIALITV